jgi:hypothetical protein
MVAADRNDTQPTIAVEGFVAHPGGFDQARLAMLASPAPEGLGGYPGSAVRVGALLAQASPGGSATHVSVESEDGEYRASIPIDQLAADGWLMIGEGPRGLDPGVGGPFRLLVPDGRTLCWNVKGVVKLRVTEGPEPDSVPENPPH